LYDNYGDSAFRAISAARHTTFGIIRTNSFYSAFKKVTGSSYAEFSERWRKHVNIYYNTLAAQMQREDSLGKPLPFPKRSFFLDARFKPGSTDTLVVLRVKSLEHPVTLLELRWTTQKPAKGKKKAKKVYHHRVLAEGDIQEGFNWSPDGKHIAFVRNGPDKNGSLVFDLFTVNIRSGKEKQLTKGARVSYPAWRDSHTIILVKTEGRTANLITFDVQSRESKQVTAFSGDVQLYHTAVSPDGKSVAIGYFGPDGKRAIALVAPDGSVKMLGSGHDDERSLRFSPDGAFVYATSLRDRVPNVFRYRVSDGAQERLTAQFTGASLLDVSPVGDSLLVTVSETRSQDRVYRVPARSRAEPVMPALPDAYTRWMTAGPEKRIPYHPETDTTRILATKKYRSLPNLTHMLSFGFPVLDNNGLNIFAFTQWADPLSHHQIFAAGNWASQSYDDTFYIFSYLNNTLRPSIGASLFKFPSVGQFYGGSYILNYLTGGEISVTMPVDIFHRPYATSFLSARLRSAGFEPSRVKIYDDPAEIGTFAPEALRQTDLLLSFKWVKRHPTRSLVQPRLAYGFQTQITAGTKALGGETAFIRPEAAVFANLPTFGRQAVYMYARGVLQSGKPLAQDFVGLSRYDNLQLDLPVQTAGIVFLSTADRVRGHRQFIIGNRAAFASTEYRVPLLPGLATTVLGVFSFQEVALALFADAGWVGGIQNLPGQTSKMLTGAGYEFKNAFSLSGFRINHAVGVGYRNAVFTKNRADWHYRIRASIPF
jgi:hypothetical protein